VANSQESPEADDRDPLAAAVLHTLVSEGREGMDLSRVAIQCQRDPADPVELGEIQAALEVLLNDGLARREGELLRPTHAAVRAAELSF
jgi:hypothetical protein